MTDVRFPPIPDIGRPAILEVEPAPVREERVGSQGLIVSINHPNELVPKLAALPKRRP